MQKKIASIKTFKEEDLSDLRNFLAEENQKTAKAYDGVLTKAIEQYLGRPFDPIKDEGRFHSIQVQGSNTTNYFVDGILIGTMTVEFGWNNDDFINNEISGRITFTPVTP